MTWLALLLLAPPARVVLVDELVRVPRASSQAIEVALKQRGAVVECRFRVERGASGVRVALHTRGGEAHRPLIATSCQQSGEFRHPVIVPGEYSLVIDNRLDERRAALVRLQLSAVFDDPLLGIRELPPERRAKVVVVSLTLFAAALMWAAWRLTRRSARS